MNEKASSIFGLCGSVFITSLLVLSLLMLTGVTFVFVSFEKLNVDGGLNGTFEGFTNSNDKAGIIVSWAAFVVLLVSFMLYAYLHHRAIRLERKESPGKTFVWVKAGTMVAFVLSLLLAILSGSFFWYLWGNPVTATIPNDDYYYIQSILMIVVTALSLLAIIVFAVMLGCCYSFKAPSSAASSSKHHSRASYVKFQ